MRASGIGKVVASKCPKRKVGDTVSLPKRTTDSMPDEDWLGCSIDGKGGGGFRLAGVSLRLMLSRRAHLNLGVRSTGTGRGRPKKQRC